METEGQMVIRDFSLGPFRHFHRVAARGSGGDASERTARPLKSCPLLPVAMWAGGPAHASWPALTPAHANSLLGGTLPPHPGRSFTEWTA
jgi:hypothetical protein